MCIKFIQLKQRYVDYSQIYVSAFKHKSPGTMLWTFCLDLWYWTISKYESGHTVTAVHTSKVYRRYFSLPCHIVAHYHASFTTLFLDS
jgi:hypothetical protein